MSVRKQRDGGWVADVTVGVKWDGTRDRRTRLCRTRREAERAESAFRLERDGRQGRVTGRIAFGEFVEQLWWPSKAGLRRNSRDTYRQVLDARLLPAFREVDLGSVNRLSIQRMILACPTRKSGQKAREVLSSVLGSAVEMGLIQVNPASFRYQYPARGERSQAGRSQGEVLGTFAEHSRYLRWLAETAPGSAEERMAVLGLCMGLRKGEVLGLDWERVDLASRTAVIDREYTLGGGRAAMDDPKTERSLRRVPIPAYAAARMEAWGPGEGPVVEGPGGGRMNPHTASNRLRRLAQGTYPDGDPLPRVTLYTMRHSFATACIAAGVEVAKLSRWLGHCNVSTTYNMYVRPRLSDLADGAVPIIDDAMKDM